VRIKTIYSVLELLRIMVSGFYSCGCHDKDAVKCFCKNRALTRKEYNEFFSPDKCECFCHEDEESDSEEVFEFDPLGDDNDDEY